MSEQKIPDGWRIEPNDDVWAIYGPNGAHVGDCIWFEDAIKLAKKWENKPSHGRWFASKKLPNKYTPMIIFILCIFLTLLFCIKISGQEQPPDWIIRGIAAVETGAHWSEPGRITLGKVGPDLGPWQMSKTVASEHGFSAYKIRTDTKYAESATKIHLTYLFGELNDWREVAKAWRAGLNGRKKQYAIDYAERVWNYGNAYQ